MGGSLVLLLLVIALAGCSGRVLALLPSAPQGEQRISTPRSLWRINVADRSFLPRYKPLEMSAPVLCAGGRDIIVASSSREVLRARSDDGTIVWRTLVKGAVNGRPYVDAQMLLVNHDGGSLDRLDPETGEIVWQYPLRGVVRNTPLVADGRVYFTSEEERLYALDARTGKWLWEYQRHAPDDFIIAGIAPPVLAGGGVVAGFADGTLVSLQPEDGSLRWSANLAEAGTQFPDVEVILPQGEDLVLASSFAGGLYALDARTGEIGWHRAGLRGIVSLLASGEELFASTGDGTVLKLTGDGSRLLWKKRYGGGCIRSLFSHHGY
ncbi:MAG: hypothetical protein FJ125_15565, partial [Deltaproteobacteria bacterium]|nr:hypothetical protein [Deltaproteobacteria bacterium]